MRTILPTNILLKLYYALAYPHLNNHIILWGSAPASHLRLLETRINTMLRVIFGIRWENWRPTVSTSEMYKSNHILKLDSLFKYNLFKMLRHLLDGGLPDLYNLLLAPYVTRHSYHTRGHRFRHPSLVCEIERRALPHQLICLNDRLSPDLLRNPMSPSLRNYKNHLLNNQ